MDSRPFDSNYSLCSGFWFTCLIYWGIGGGGEN